VSDESTRIDQWLYAAMKADSTLTALIGGSSDPRVYSELAPQQAAYPLVLFVNQSNIDVIGATENTRLHVQSIYAITGIDDTGTWVGDLQDIADRIDYLFHASTGGTADSATIYTSHRLQPLRLVEERDGRQIRRLGGLFRIYAKR